MSRVFTLQLPAATSELFHLQAMAGTESLQLTFKWDATAKEVYDNFLLMMNRRVRSLPMKEQDGTLLRDYDYWSYWATVPSTYELMEGFIETAEALPVALEGLRHDQQVNYMLQEKQFSNEAFQLRALYIEQMCWSVRILYASESIVMSLRDGGASYFSDGTYVRFLYDKEGIIDYDSLEYVTLEVGIA